MYIIDITWRHRNDFHFVAICRHCNHQSRWGDGYADDYYQTQVFPSRHCPDCGINEFGKTKMIVEKMLWEGRWIDGRYIVRDFNGHIVADNFKSRKEALEWIASKHDSSTPNASTESSDSRSHTRLRE